MFPIMLNFFTVKFAEKSISATEIKDNDRIRNVVPLTFTLPK